MVRYMCWHMRLFFSIVYITNRKRKIQTMLFSQLKVSFISYTSPKPMAEAGDGLSSLWVHSVLMHTPAFSLHLPWRQRVLGHEGKIQQGKELFWAHDAKSFCQVCVKPGGGNIYICIFWKKNEYNLHIKFEICSYVCREYLEKQWENECANCIAYVIKRDLQEKPFQICNGVRRQGLESQHRQHDAQPHWNAQKELLSAARAEPPVPAVNVPAVNVPPVNVPAAFRPEASRQFCNNHAWMNEWFVSVTTYNI